MSRTGITGADGVSNDMELPTGAPPIMPAGVHQVTNVGSTEVHIIFVEPAVGIAPVKPLVGFVSPFGASPEAYTKLAEDDHWITGKMHLAAKCGDAPHSHNDHFIYVLEGEALAVSAIPDIDRPDDFAEPNRVPLAIGMAAPIPAGHHLCMNPKDEQITIIFFERKEAGDL